MTVITHQKVHYVTQRGCHNLRLWMIHDGWVVLWEWKMKGSQEEFLNGKFHNTRWEAIVQMDTSQILGVWEWRIWAEDRKMKVSSFCGRPVPRRGCSTINGWMDLRSQFLTLIYRVSQEECARLRESVPYVKLYRYNPKHLYSMLNGCGNSGH
jgi:hypothetical protein